MEINDKSLIILQNIHYEYFKIDFEKAYDHLDWNFLDKIWESFWVQMEDVDVEMYENRVFLP